MSTFWNQKYGCFRMRASTTYSKSSTQDLLIKDLSVKTSAPKRVNFLTIGFLENYKLFLVRKKFIRK